MSEWAQYTLVAVAWLCSVTAGILVWRATKRIWNEK